MNKYLFMDIDGVLNHEDWFKTPGVKDKKELWGCGMILNALL